MTFTLAKETEALSGFEAAAKCEWEKLRLFRANFCGEAEGEGMCKEEEEELEPYLRPGHLKVSIMNNSS